MTYCDGSSQAIITINSSIAREVIRSDFPPVEVIVSSPGVPARVYGEGLNTINCQGLGNLGFVEYNGFVSFQTINYLGCTGWQLYVNGVAQGNQFIYFPGAEIVRQYTNQWNIKINDSRGQIFFKNYPTEPTYTIACGDECPPNHIKCECLNYPGYCCIPCDEVKNSIIQIRNQVRNLRR